MVVSVVYVHSKVESARGNEPPLTALVYSPPNFFKPRRICRRVNDGMPDVEVILVGLN